MDRIVLAPSELEPRFEPIWLWFEYYKLALEQQALAKTTNASKDFYTKWGKVTSRTKFASWWKEHYFLFGKMGVRVAKAIETPDDWLPLIVPLTEKITDLVFQFRVIVEWHQEKLAEKQGVKRFTKAGNILPRGEFDLTQGRELRVYQASIALAIYRKFMKRGVRPVINPALLQKIREYFLTEADGIPGPLLANKGSGDIPALRNLRRYFQQAEDLMIAAAKGDFPGERTKQRE